LTVPQVQIGTRPIASKMAAAATTMANVAKTARLWGISDRAPALLIDNLPKAAMVPRPPPIGKPGEDCARRPSR
jgi:hypothetical protein